VSSLVLVPLKEHSGAYGNQRFRMYLPPFAEVFCKNSILSKYAAGQTQNIKKIKQFQRQMFSKR